MMARFYPLNYMSNYVNMQLDHVDMQHNCVSMPDNYVNMWFKLCFLNDLYNLHVYIVILYALS